MEFDLENPLADSIQTLFAIELDHLPCFDYVKKLKSGVFNVSVREEAISMILHVQLCSNLDPFIPYLAINYLDRFLCKQGMPLGKPWILKLLAVSCLSLASKMRKTVCSVSDFQGEEGFIFDQQTVQRMEVLVLSALKWRMRSITPFSFVQFFISSFKLKDPPLQQALKARALHILFNAQHDIKLLAFKPSIVAASALLSASHELFPLQFSCFRQEISSCKYVNKEELSECCNAIQDLLIDDYESVFDLASSTETAVNVLDRHWSSSESEITGSNKRRKISNLSKESTLEV